MEILQSSSSICKRGRPPISTTPRNIKRRKSYNMQKFVNEIKNKYTNLPDIVMSSPGKIAWPSLQSRLSVQRVTDLENIARNVTTLLRNIGKHHKKVVTSILTKDVSKNACGEYFPFLSPEYIKNSHVPSFLTASWRTHQYSKILEHDIFHQDYARDVQRKVFHDVEIECLLEWCKTIEFAK